MDGLNIQGIGSGYVKGLVLKQQLEALKQEQKRQDILLEMEVGKARQGAEAMKQQQEQQRLLFPYAERGLAAETGITESKLPIAQAISAGRPVGPEQEMLMYGKTAQPQPEFWQRTYFADPSISMQEKAQTLGRFNLEPGKAEDVAMGAIKQHYDRIGKPEEFAAYAKEFNKQQSKILESMMKIYYGQTLRTGEAVRKEGVSAIDEIRKSFKQNLQQLRMKGMEPGVYPEDIAQEKYNIHQEYFGRLKELNQPLPMKEVKNYVKELADQWQKERDALVARGKGWFRSDTTKLVKELDMSYAQKLVDLIGQDLADELLGGVEEEPGKGEGR